MAESWKQWEGTIVDGKFRLEQFLGGSDHSAVFLTQPSEGGAKAAIKFVPASPQALDFQRTSWEQTARLSHPHLIRLFGGGQCRLGNLDLVYAVMECAEENLAQVLPDRALSADEARDTLGPVLATLQYLHGKGVAHGSLKPSNILAVQDQLKLSSDQIRAFGNPGLPQDSSPYAAPEIARDRAQAASDVWSLGITLVEVLTQRAPERAANGQPIIPSDLPEPFHEIVTHCLAWAPQDRWSIGQITERLEAVSPPPKPKPAGAAARLHANEPIRQSLPLELGSGRRLMVSGISFLLVLFAIYAGSQLLHRAGSTGSSQPSGSSASDSSRRGDALGPDSSATARPYSSKSAPLAPESSAPSSRGQVLERVEPTVSASARSTITGKIRVRADLTVDASGKVTEARLVTPGPSKYFASRALEAARRWTFVPARVDGQAAQTHWTLHFAFTRRGTEVDAEQTEP
jgi:TonB family protein